MYEYSRLYFVNAMLMLPGTLPQRIMQQGKWEPVAQPSPVSHAYYTRMVKAHLNVLTKRSV